jgi:hypothetical protein
MLKGLSSIYMMQIAYFPYLNMRNIDVIEFGDVKVWNFERKAQEYIPDVALRERVKALLYSNVKNDQPLKDIGVVSISSIDFRELNNEELQLVDQVRLIFFLAFLAGVNVCVRGPNSGHYMATSENFLLTMQNFDPASEHIAQTSGFLVSFSEGGYKIGQLKFHTPPYVPTPFQFALDVDLILKLSDIQKRNKRLYERILRATSILFESYYNDPNVSLYARILMQASAFEVLLDLPEGRERQDFKKKIKQYTVRANEKSRRYFSERRGGRKAPETEPLKVIWADRFYTLRNHIIHGEHLSRQEFVFQRREAHLVIAVLFFVLLVKELINDKLRRKGKYFLDNITWTKYHNGHEVKEGFIYERNTAPRK